MAWYYGTFSCGCEGRVNICGPVKNRQWIADRKFESCCESCFEKRLAEEKEKLNKEASEKAEEMDLPNLTGTEKQILWAMTLRQKLIDNAEKMDEEYFKNYYGPELVAEEVPIILNYILINRTEAKYYINYRNSDIRRILYNEKYEALKPDEEKAKEKLNKQMEKMVKDEATIFPEKRCTNSIVEISIEKNTVKVHFEKDDDFKNIVKDLDYSWGDGYWERTIHEKNGTVEDRVAELGNKLLKAGFPIMILDEVIREKAINADYKCEIYRWIDIRKNEFRITWYGMNDKLYKVARSIPSSSYKYSAVYIKIEHYGEVEEFAKLYKFHFTDNAIKAIESYKKELKEIKTVKVKTIEQEEIKDGLEEILNSSTEILDDLLDD